MITCNQIDVDHLALSCDCCEDVTAILNRFY